MEPSSPTSLLVASAHGSSEDVQPRSSAAAERCYCLGRLFTWLKKEHSDVWVQCNFINIIIGSVFSLGSYIYAHIGAKDRGRIMRPNLSGDILSNTSLFIESVLILKTAYQIYKVRSDPHPFSSHKTVSWQLLLGIVASGCGIAALIVYPTEEFPPQINK